MITILFWSLFNSSMCGATTNVVENLSAKYLKSVKMETDLAVTKSELYSLSLNNLDSSLSNDQTKIAFWLNVYNGHVQETLRRNPELYKNRSRFFSQNSLKFKDFSLSLDSIEHGILRRSQWKYGLGHIKKWFVSDHEKKLRVHHPDWRIHFALNCGAGSCPAIYYYQSEKLEQQLAQATQSFLEQDVTYNKLENKVHLSPIFLWFNGDFGGPSGIKKILNERLELMTDKRTELIYKDYDWSLSLQ